jgi:GNAT superfamily N-acetyltransferase
MSIAVRRARPGDAKHIEMLMESMGWAHGHPEDWPDEQAVRTELMVPPAALFLGLCDNDPAGFALACPVFRARRRPRAWQLTALYVLTHERGRGLGRALLHAVAAAAREDGAASLLLPDRPEMRL